MNANAKLKEILKEAKIKKPSYFNEGNIFTHKFGEQEQKRPQDRILTDEDLGLSTPKRVKNTQNKEA